MSWLQIHVCNPCGLQAPSFKFASSLISAKWRFFSPLFPSLGDTSSERERGRKSLYSMRAFHFYFLQPLHIRPPSRSHTHTHTHINAATLTITNTFMCTSQWSVGKEGQLLIIKRYLFWSCGVLNSSYTWHFFLPY